MRIANEGRTRSACSLFPHLTEFCVIRCIFLFFLIAKVSILIHMYVFVVQDVIYTIELQLQLIYYKFLSDAHIGAHSAVSLPLSKISMKEVVHPIINNWQFVVNFVRASWGGIILTFVVLFIWKQRRPHMFIFNQIRTDVSQRAAGEIVTGWTHPQDPPSRPGNDV